MFNQSSLFIASTISTVFKILVFYTICQVVYIEISVQVLLGQFFYIYCVSSSKCS